MIYPAFGQHLPVKHSVKVQLPTNCNRCASPPRVTWTCTTKTQADLKKAVLDLLRPLDYGRKIVKDQQAQLNVDQEVQLLEKLNTCSTPALDMRLNGLWRLVYTTSKSILGVSRPTCLRPTIMEQLIDLDGRRVQNKERVQLGPLHIDIAIEAEITDVTQSRVTVQFDKFVFFGLVPISVRNDNRFIGFVDVSTTVL